MTHTSNCEFDHQMMGVALGMARRGLGMAWPNPSVGVVIADELSGELIARGFTQAGGRPHAETEALAAAGAGAFGKTLYVTLEPCSHHGQTPPCADAIINAGISRVVVSGLDPDPRVGGRGVAMLERAGIMVETGVRRAEAQSIAAGHILRVTERRPFVQIKMALSGDFEIARGDGVGPVWVTGPNARAHGHMLRAMADAILIGSGTLADDNPSLTCRLPGLEDRSPVRVVVASRDALKEGMAVLKGAPAVPVWLATERGDADEPGGTAGLGYEVLNVPSVGGKIWLPGLAEALVSRGITRLLVEGGPTMWRAFAMAGLVDEVVAFIASGESGRISSGTRSRNDDGGREVVSRLSRLVPGLNLRVTHVRNLGDDQMITLQPS